MTCRFCNKQIPDDSIYCPYCGKKIETENDNNNESNQTFENKSGFTFSNSKEDIRNNPNVKSLKVWRVPAAILYFDLVEKKMMIHISRDLSPVLTPDDIVSYKITKNGFLNVITRFADHPLYVTRVNGPELQLKVIMMMKMLYE